MKAKETKNEYEYKHLRICEKWLQIESCRKCLFEILCNYQKQNGLQQNAWWDWEESQETEIKKE